MAPEELFWGTRDSATAFVSKCAACVYTPLCFSACNTPPYYTFVAVEAGDVKRRQYLLAIGTVGAGVLAGCVANDEDDPGGQSSDNTDSLTPGDSGNDATGTDTSGESETPTETDTSDESETPSETEDTEHEALAVLDSYIEAANEKDLDTLAEVMHSRHPFNPDNLDDAKMENVSFALNDGDNYEPELVDEEFTTDDIREIPNIGFWFEEMDVTLDDVLEGEKAVLAEVSYETTENGSTVTKTEKLTLLTEDGDWKVFFPYQEPVDVPQDEPVDDERYDIVDDIEFDAETERATVYFSDLGDIEAEEVVIYSTSLDDSSKAWSEESDTLPRLNYLVSPFDPDGDEIVVTIRFEDREIVIHRETYEPDADN